MSEEPIWIRQDVVFTLHKIHMDYFGGGGYDLRDEGLLASALARPQNRWLYDTPKPDLCDLAAEYAFGIVHNHPFVDGNKRTGFITMCQFLKINGLRFLAPREEKYGIIIKLAEGNLSCENLAQWLRSNCEPF